MYLISPTRSLTLVYTFSIFSWPDSFRASEILLQFSSILQVPCLNQVPGHSIHFVFRKRFTLLRYVNVLGVPRGFLLLLMMAHYIKLFHMVLSKGDIWPFIEVLHILLISMWFVNFLLNLDQGPRILSSLWREIPAVLAPSIQCMGKVKYNSIKAKDNICMNYTICY